MLFFLKEFVQDVSNDLPLEGVFCFAYGSIAFLLDVIFENVSIAFLLESVFKAVSVTLPLEDVSYFFSLIKCSAFFYS